MPEASGPESVVGAVAVRAENPRRGRRPLAAVPARAPAPPRPAGSVVSATKFVVLAVPMVPPRLVPRSSSDAPAVTAEREPVLKTIGLAAFGVSVMVLPPTARVVVPPEAAVSAPVPAAAAALSTNVVPLVMEAIVVPDVMLGPETTMPATRPAVLATVTVVLAVVVTLPRLTTLPRDSVVLALALPRMLKLPPPSVSVAPVPAPGMAPPARRLFKLVTVLSSVSVPPSLMVLPRNALLALPL